MGILEGVVGIGGAMLVLGAIYNIKFLVYAGVALIVAPFIAKALIG